jgi:vancomycin permeability regulator SanA
VHFGAGRLYTLSDPALETASENIQVAIVFGGGARNGKPLPLLAERLDTAKSILDRGYVDKLILSGDNRTLDYNEPIAMYDYLVSKGVSPDALQLDQAGRSTYETCERAKKIFNLTKAILVSEATHLPRATYLCKSFGVDAIGVISEGRTATGLYSSQRWREIFARDKALFNVYFIGERTVLGDPIDLQL